MRECKDLSIEETSADSRARTARLRFVCACAEAGYGVGARRVKSNQDSVFREFDSNNILSNLGEQAHFLQDKKMTYPDCKEKEAFILNDPERLRLLEEEFGDIEEVFIASSDFIEMNTDFELLKENEFEVSEELLTSKKQDYWLYIMTDEGDLVQIPKDLL